jgi:hypothetical protein
MKSRLLREPKGSWVAVAVSGALAVVLGACNGNPPASASQPTDLPAAVAPPKTPCPVRLIHSKMVKNLEMDVYTTVVNISTSDITAIAFGASHTDRFGDMWEPYKTSLSSEETIRKGQSRSMHWEVLMETRSGIEHSKPGSSELFVDKVAFADGRVLRVGEMEGCGFHF